MITVIEQDAIAAARPSFQKISIPASDNAIPFWTGVAYIETELPGGNATVTTIGDGETHPYRQVTIFGPPANTLTFGEAGNVRLAGGTTRALGANDSTTLVQRPDGNWYELSNANH